MRKSRSFLKKIPFAATLYRTLALPIKYLLFVKQFVHFKNTFKDKTRFILKWKDVVPCLFDNTKKTGFDSHYIYHIAWAIRVLKKLKPDRHVDISSSLYFVVNASAYTPIDFYDYRPAEIYLDGLKTYSADLLNLPFSDNSISSLSCMHVVEHIGLGRYGDSINYNGDCIAIAELKRVIMKNGYLLFVVPLGATAVIKFNAHRIYTYQQIRELFNGFTIEEFALIPDNYERIGLIENPDETILAKQHYACGCFLLRKQ